MSQINVVLVHADRREDQTVTTGTKAWELFQESPEVIAARVDGMLRDLAYEVAEGDEVEPVAIDSPDGHDGFLLEAQQIARILEGFLDATTTDTKFGALT